MFVIVQVCFILVALFTSCQPPESPKMPKQILRINIADEPHSLDPRKARQLSDLTLIRMLFEGLTRIGPSEKPEPALAQEIIVSNDLKTYTFKLRPSKWSNGDPVVAEDFIYAWKKSLDPTFVSDNASQLYVIKNAKLAKEGKASLNEVGIKVLDALTLQVELENPTPYFLELASSPIFFPVNAKVDRENGRWAEKLQMYTCNGPFFLSEWRHHDLIEVSKNHSYWDASSVHLPKIMVTMVKEDAEFKMFEKKELDWAGSPFSILPIDALPKLKRDQELKSKAALGTYFIRLNTKMAPLDRTAMRKALALAVNRQAIVEHVIQGNQTPATGLVPVSMGLQKHPYFKDADLMEAKRLFEQVGPEKQILAKMKLTYISSERTHLLAQTIQQQWFESFGIRVELEALERKVYYDRISKGGYQLALGSWVADYNDPINFLEVFKFKSSGTNAQWENRDYIKLLDASASVSDQKERESLLARSEELLISEMPLIPIYHYTMLYVNNDDVKNAVLSPLGSVDFKWAYFEDKQQAEKGDLR
jgi:oligopeptide transport system substrate-binding protein